MSADSDKILMGSIGSNIKEVTNKHGSIEAGLFVRLASDDTIAATTGTVIGLSLGKDLSDTGNTSIARKGLRVPAKLTAGFDPAIGAQVFMVKATGLAGAEDGGNTTGLNAVYVSERVGGTGQNKGIDEATHAAVGVALIDFPGGL